MAERWIFLYGFAKNERANIGKIELKALQEVAKEVLEANESQLEIALSKGELMDVCYRNEDAEWPNSG